VYQPAWLLTGSTRAGSIMEPARSTGSVAWCQIYTVTGSAAALGHEQQVHALGDLLRCARARHDVREDRGVLVRRQRRVAAAAPVALLDARLPCGACRRAELWKWRRQNAGSIGCIVCLGHVRELKQESIDMHGGLRALSVLRSLLGVMCLKH